MNVAFPTTVIGRPQAHRATVVAVEQLTPKMRRIVLEGEALDSHNSDLPAQWLKVVFGGLEEKMRPNRAYKIRRLYPGWRTMEIDFVLHGDQGLASAWARRAKIADLLCLGAPRGGYRLDPDARWRLLAEDETALPAIASISESPGGASAPTRVLVETPSAEDAQALRRSAVTDIQWLPRDRGERSGQLLEDALCSLSFPHEAGQVFVAGEAMAVKRVRRDLFLRAPQARVEAKGNWTLGQADYRESD